MTTVQALIIEDDSNNMAVLSELLEGENAQCATIQDPRAIEQYMANNTPPDVIFLDLEMPYIDGYEALDMFKANPTWQDVPVVACTVHVSEFHVARDKPFHSFIGKPLNADQFTEHLKKILNGERVWDISSGSY